MTYDASIQHQGACNSQEIADLDVQARVFEAGKIQQHLLDMSASHDHYVHAAAATQHELTEEREVLQDLRNGLLECEADCEGRGHQLAESSICLQRLRRDLCSKQDVWQRQQIVVQHERKQIIASTREAHAELDTLRTTNQQLLLELDGARSCVCRRRAPEPANEKYRSMLAYLH